MVLKQYLMINFIRYMPIQENIAKGVYDLTIGPLLGIFGKKVDYFEKLDDDKDQAETEL